MLHADATDSYWDTSIWAPLAVPGSGISLHSNRFCHLLVMLYWGDGSTLPVPNYLIRKRITKFHMISVVFYVCELNELIHFCASISSF